MIAKQLQETTIEGTYELFDEVKATTTDGKEVVVLQSVGRHSLAQLETDKRITEENAAERLASLQAKIDAIKAL